MPLYRYCPLCAAEMTWRQSDARARQVCPTCGFICYENPVPAAGSLIERDGRVLMVQRKYPPYVGGWTLPAGFIEWDETPEQAAVRETEEETGLRVEVTGLFGVFPWRHEYKDGQTHDNGLLVVYLAAILGGELQAGDDAQAVGWFAADALPAEIAFSSHRVALALWVEAVQRKKLEG
jgi:ADP-ribose pyrophosphatase YjhB (NUDIX family)